MDETIMNDRTPCVDYEALVTYLYDECAPTERESIATHLAICASCAEEVRALGDTRAHLASWSPPALPLGFQITRTESDQAPTVVPFAGPANRSSRSEGWYRQPLPAWAQMAAAVAIFAAGMSVSAIRSSGEPATRVAQSSARQPVSADAARPVDAPVVTRAEFARVEARLRAMESADVSRASYTPPAGGSPDDSDVRLRLSALEDRFVRSEGETLKSLATLARAVDANSREMDASRQVAQKFNLMEEELQDHRQVLTRVVPGLAVRTALTSGGR
jgi:hypothetical protein